MDNVLFDYEFQHIETCPHYAYLGAFAFHEHKLMFFLQNEAI